MAPPRPNNIEECLVCLDCLFLSADVDADGEPEQSEVPSPVSEILFSLIFYTVYMLKIAQKNIKNLICSNVQTTVLNILTKNMYYVI